MPPLTPPSSSPLTGGGHSQHHHLGLPGEQHQPDGVGRADLHLPNLHAVPLAGLHPPRLHAQPQVPGSPLAPRQPGHEQQPGVHLLLHCYGNKTTPLLRRYSNTTTQLRLPYGNTTTQEHPRTCYRFLLTIYKCLEPLVVPGEHLYSADIGFELVPPLGWLPVVLLLGEGWAPADVVESNPISLGAAVKKAVHRVALPLQRQASSCLYTEGDTLISSTVTSSSMRVFSLA